MKRGGQETLLMIASAVLWLALVGLGGAGHWLAALFVLLALVAVYSALGSVKSGRFDIGLLMFPSLVWLAFWGASFAIADHYAVLFSGRAPEHTLFGFHPSFAAIIVLYWLIPTALMGFGFDTVKDRWLSQQRWDAFVRAVNADDSSNEEGPDHV